MPKHQFAQQPNPPVSSFFDMYMYCSVCIPNFLSDESFLDKTLKLKLCMKNLVENLLDFILNGSETVPTRIDPWNCIID